MIFDLLAPPQGPRERGQKKCAVARPIHVSNIYTKFGWISSNGSAKITSNQIMEGFNLTIILVLLLILFSSMDFKHKIIQWNCRGLKPNYNEVSLLISEYNPSVFCFPETFLKPDDNISLRGFNIYNYVHTDCLRPSGGASIFVKSSFPQRKIDLQTELQATAVSVTLDRE